jgi:predicted DNA-binding transcriptional regulator YafY
MYLMREGRKRFREFPVSLDLPSLPREIALALFHWDRQSRSAKRIWHHTQKIEPQKDGSVIFSAEVAGVEEVKHWVLSWGKNAEVIAPDFLRYEITSELRATLKKYLDKAAIADEV